MNDGISTPNVDKVIEPYLVKFCDIDSPDWVAAIEKAERKLAKIEQRKNAAFRDQREVKAGYEAMWERDIGSKIAGGGDVVPCLYGNHRLLLRSMGIKRSYLYHLYRIVDFLKPSSILEIGCGTGINSVLLANRFPDIRVSGIELSSSGVRHFRRFLDDVLPGAIIDFAPEPLVSATAHQRVAVVQADAAKLPFLESSFDMVVTNLALEQMEQIRDTVLTEASRVCRHHTVMIEPFRDWNGSGLRKRYTEAMGYFSGRVDDLPRYGLHPVHVTNDFPAKLLLGVGLVVASTNKQA